MLGWLFKGVNLPLLVAGVLFAAYTLIFGNPYSLSVLAIAGIYALLVIGFQFIFGHAGAISLAQAAFFGIGAYVSGILAIEFGWSFVVTFPLAILLPTVLAVVVAAPVLKLEEHYFALATLGLGLVALLVATQWDAVTGGTNGLAGVPNFKLFGYETKQRIEKLMFVWTFVLIGALLAHQIMRGLYGLTHKITRENSTVAMSIGINVSALRFSAFVISAGYAGAAGAFIAHIIRVVSPQNLEFSVMISCLTMAVIGGRTSVGGAILGAVLLIHLPEWFRFLDDYRLISYGAATLVMVIAAPEGMVGAFVSLRQRFLPERPPPPAPKLHALKTPNLSSATGPLLRIDRMQKAFGGVNAIDNVSLEIRRGEILGLIGPNGSGKTTLVNLISGVYAPDGGEVWFAGEDITKLPPYKISRLGMARTFQNVNLVGDMSALDNVAVARASASKASMRAAVLTIGRDQTLVRAREHAMALLETVGASDAALQSCDSLPYGVKRHVEIARALALEPQLVLLDEPAAGLNDAEQMDLAEQLKNLPDAGITLLVIEHNMRFLLTLAERIVCLDHGEIIAQGSPEDIVSNPAVIEAYLGTADETAI